MKKQVKLKFKRIVLAQRKCPTKNCVGFLLGPYPLDGVGLLVSHWRCEHCGSLFETKLVKVREENRNL